MIHFIVVVFGLALFETISSVDNAIVNAHILRTVSEKYKRIFLVWGLPIAVFLVRGVLPFLIVWMASPTLTFHQAISATLTHSDQVESSITQSKPLLLLGGGVYLFLVFLSWLFMEEKKYAFLVENFIHKQSIWFYAFASVLLTSVIYYSVQKHPILALAASLGATAFFITDGFKKNAAEKEKELMKPGLSAWSKILYLEVLDASFSIDGVIGAFAFTLSVPLIILGNGLGAFVVREFTIRGLDIITRYAYLKNGAMYSIGMLGGIMILEAFGNEYPFWLAPLNTFVLLATFFLLSLREIEEAQEPVKG
jgi:hypothetical protein